MENLAEIKDYGVFKQQLDVEFSRTAEGFVRIGYLLKKARDTEILQESGYKTVAEFAKAEYGLEKDTVSRFIAINDRFSVGGNSEHLETQYSQYGVAKLSEMLTLPDAIVEELSPLMTRKEIQTVKKEIKEEEKITDIEVMLENQDERQIELENNMEKAMHQYNYEHKEEYLKLWDAVNNTMYDGSNAPVIEKIMDTLAPAGAAMLTVRIKGLGKMMISLRGKEQDVGLVNVRSNEKESYSWEQFIKILEKLCESYESPEKEWEKLYGEQFKEQTETDKKKQEVAPVQQKCEEVKKDNEEQENVDEQLPGQMNVDDYPELTPERKEESNPNFEKEMQEAEKGPEKVEGEIVENAEEKTDSYNAEQNEERGYKAVVTENIRKLQSIWEGNYVNKIDLMLDMVSDLKWRLEKIKELEEMEEEEGE